MTASKAQSVSRTRARSAIGRPLGEPSTDAYSGAVALGQAIRRARGARGLSQQELARQLCVDPSRVGSLERGVVRSPRLLLVSEISVAFQIGVGAFVVAFARGSGATAVEGDHGADGMRGLSPRPPAADRTRADTDAAAMGAMLRFLRRREQLTQAELGARAGMVKHHVGRLEHGRRRNPELSTVVRLAKALGDEHGTALSTEQVAVWLVQAFAGEITTPDVLEALD